MHSSTAFCIPRWDCVDCPVSPEKRASRDCKGLPDPLERTESKAVPAKRDPLAASDPQVNLVSPVSKGRPDCRETPVPREGPAQKVTWVPRERTAWMANQASESNPHERKLVLHTG